LKLLGFEVELLTFADFGNARFHRDPDPRISRFGRPSLWAKAIQFVGKAWFSALERSSRFRIYQTGDVWKAKAGARKINFRLRETRPDIVIFPDQASPAVWLDKLPGQRWIQVSHHQALRFVNIPEIGDHSLRDALAATRLERSQFERCDVCIVPSEYMADVVRSFVSDTKPIKVISNLVGGIIPEVEKSSLDRKRIFIPSGGSRFKGADIVPELVAAIHSGFPAGRDEGVEFFISGELSSAQRDRILALTPNVRLVAPGHLSHADTLAQLALSRVCVSPTWIENQSMALLEAKSLGVPFATFDVGGNRELAGSSDRVVSRGDIQALAHASVELLGLPKENIGNWDFRARNKSALDQWSRLLSSFSQ
jgi:glycosyltransferase involved in cell wall biosynthesis